jgi:hypothetical protein
VFVMPVDIDVLIGGTYYPFVVQNNQRDQNYILHVTGSSGLLSSLSVDRLEWILKSASSEALAFHMFYDPLADGTQYEPYLDSVIAKGGSTPYTYSVTAGSLPAGITLGSTTGKLTGTPTASGSFTFTVRGHENGVNFEDVEYTLNIAAGSYVPGDADGSGSVDIDDVVYLIAYIFTSGPEPSPLNAGDVDGSCAIDIDDVVYLIAYIFTGGPAPLLGCAG